MTFGKLFMRQMIYVSAASWKLGQEDVDEILRAARRNNPAHGVTGMLLYIDLGFFQILEGPPDGVETVYAKILADKRHTAQRILVDEEVGERLFAQWSMGFDKPDPKRAAAADIFTATRTTIEDKVPLAKAIAAARLVRSFYTVNAARDFV